MSDFLSRISHFSPKRLALLADELQHRVSALEDQLEQQLQRVHQPVAIVGIGCRFPGHVDSPEAYWSLLEQGIDAIEEVPRERWDVDAVYDADPDAPGRMSTRFGGFVDEVDQFDPHFFGISPREAERMDPQQRLLLEVSWRALEQAGIDPDALRGSRTGVYVGMSASDYFQLLRDGGRETFDAYTASGTAHSIASGRLSYVLGTHGPSLSIDTACSSSLVAIHHAVQSLRRGESDLALAGGVNLILQPDVTIALSRAHMMAPDGRCKAFDARADGFVRGEGCGMLVLKRLDDAVRDRNEIWAVIRGTAVNQDGRSNGLTAPNGPAQEAVLRDALADAGVAPADVDFVETHGTGTSLGDPIEVGALARVLGADRAPDHPLIIGSVKANIGHLEAAAGVAGLIKLVLSLRHGRVPRQPHFVTPNPFIPWSDLPVRVPQQALAWPERADGVRVGGVSSFGFSGTNAHLVISAPPVVSRSESAAPAVYADPIVVPHAEAHDRPRHVLLISSRHADARRALAAAHRECLAAGVSWPDLAFSTNTGRQVMPYRLAISAGDAHEALARLDEFLGHDDAQAANTSHVTGRPSRIAMLFTGQGAQYAGMGRQLYARHAGFRNTFDACADIARDLLPEPLERVVFSDEAGETMSDTAWAQPALFALEYSLASLWRSWGIQPTALIGHSLGEYVAACVAGVMTLPDAMRLVVARGRLMSALPRTGGMLAILADATQVGALLTANELPLTIAAVNAPDAVVVSGALDAIARCEAQAAARGWVTSRLAVSHAFHSPLMTPMLHEFGAVARSIAYQPATLDLVSNLTGVLLSPTAIDAEYWVRQTASPVVFARGVETLWSMGCTTLLEVGPHPTLLGFARQVSPPPSARYIPSLRRGADEWETLLDGVSALALDGQPVDWRAFDAPYDRTRVPAPGYPFQRERYWVNTPEAPSGPAQPVAAGIEYDVRWIARPREGSLSPAEISATLTPAVAGVAQKYDLDAYAAFHTRLNQLCVDYIRRAFDGLLGTPVPETRWTLDSVMRDGRIGARHARLVKRLLETLAEEGFLAPDAEGWRVMRWPAVAPDDAATATAALAATHPVGEPVLTVTARCALALADVLQGSTDPLTLLFPGGSTADMERLYAHTPPARVYNALLARCAQLVAEQRGSGRPIRILEVGAGTGSATSAVLNALQGCRVEYTVTDVSPLFMHRARERFAAYESVQFATLDITRDPLTQGFVASSFDLVIGANVFHATADTLHALRAAVTLLAPSGHLLLLEGTAPQRFGDLTVGLLEGWWAFTDTERRQYALMSRTRWQEALADAGFATSAVLVDDGSGPVLDEQAIFIAQMPVAQSVSPRRWLLLGDETCNVQGLATALSATGDSAQHAPLSGDAVNAMTQPAPTDVVVVATPSAPMVGAKAAEVWSDQERVLQPFLQVVQQLVNGSGVPPRLHLVTCGAQPVAGRITNPAHATLWGLSHVVSLEHPELRHRRIDLEAPLGEVTSLGLLVPELCSDSRDDQVGFRDGVRYVRRLARAELPPRRVTTLLPDRTVLVVGGARGIGLRAADWLVSRGARHVMLMGRSAPRGEALTVIDRMRASGARVEWEQGDVVQEADVRRVLERLRTTMPPLQGIVHSAGLLSDGVVGSLSWSQVTTVLAPKLTGTMLLAEVAGPLDFFVLFSSGASVAGSPGQANHAAANAFEDAFAWWRAGLGHPTLSINWGPWGETGAAVDHAVPVGDFLRLLPPPVALAALNRAMAQPTAGAAFAQPQVAVFDADWRAASPRAQQLLSIPLLEDLRLHTEVPFAAPAPAPAPAALMAATMSSAAPIATALAGAQGTSGVAGLSAQSSLIARLAITPAGRRRVVVQREVRQLAASVLGIGSPESIDVDEPFAALGLDSLMAVELRNRIGIVSGERLAATITYDYPSVRALSDHLAGLLLKEHGDVDGASVVTSDLPQQRAAALAGDVDALDALSEAELATILDDHLSRLLDE